MGRHERARWKAGWEELFRSYVPVSNERRTVRVEVSEQGDGGFAVVDIETVWRRRSDGASRRWRARASKGYTRLADGRWLLVYHTGLLGYDAR